MTQISEKAFPWRKAAGLSAVLACVALLIGAIPTQAKAKVSADPIFLDEIDKTSIYAGYTAKPWRDREKDFILKAFSQARKLAPGLMQRVTAYRPLKFYRTTTGGPTTDAKAIISHNGVYFMDKGFGTFSDKNLKRLTSTVVHELAHLADQSYRMMTTKRWSDLVRGRINRVRQALKREGVILSNKGMTPEQLGERNRKYNRLARKEGMPTLYSSTSLSEAMAEFVAYIATKGFKAPKPIMAFIHDNFLSTPYKPDEITRAFHQAYDLSARGEQAKSIRAFSRLLAAYPDFNQVHYFRGMIADRNGDYDLALRDYKEALKAFGTVPKYSSLLHASIGGILWGNNRHDEAIRHYTEGIELEADPIEVAIIYGARASVWFSAGNYDKAIIDTTTAIKKEPENARYYLTRARSFGRKKEFTKALADYAKGIQLEPDITDFYNFRASLYKDMKKPGKAFADYIKWIELEPDDADPYRYRGKLYESMKKPGKALADYTKAIQLAPDEAITYLYRGALHEEMKKPGAALADYTKWIELEPDDAGAYNLRALLYKSMKKTGEAISDYSKMIELEPKNVKTYLSRASLLAGKKDFDKAVRDYSKAIELDPKNVEIHLSRAKVWQDKKDYAKEDSDFAAAIAIDPENTAIYSARAKSFEKRKDCGKALLDYAFILKKKPNAFSVRINRGKCLLETKDFAAVIADVTAVTRIFRFPAPDLLLLRGQAYVETGQFKKAIADLNKAKAAPHLALKVDKWIKKAKEGMAR